MPIADHIQRTLLNQFMQEVITDGTHKLRCFISVPGDGSAPLPALIFLHGIGENGSNLNLVLKYGPLRQLQDNIYTGKPKIIIHPQNPGSTWSISEIDEVIEYIKNNYNVNSNKISLMGCSLGGFGTWTYAQSAAHVKKLACIVPICGGGNDPSKAFVLADEAIPGWAAHAINDNIVSYNTTKRMVDAVNKLANKQQILFSEYGMSGHLAWNYFLRPNYHVYDWIDYQDLSHRAKPEGVQGILQLNIQVALQDKQLTLKVV